MGIFDKLTGKSKKDEFDDLPPLPDMEGDEDFRLPPMPSPQQQGDIDLAGMRSGVPPSPRPAPTFSEPMGLPEVPEPSTPEPKEHEQVTLLTEDIEEIAEAIISEKWTEISKEMEVLRRELEIANSNIDNMHTNIEKIESRLDDMQRAIFEKMESYGKTINDVNVELQAIDRVFRDVMPTFTENVKTLSSITTKTPTSVKKKTPSKRKRK